MVVVIINVGGGDDDDVFEVLLEDEDVELEAEGTIVVHRADVARARDEGAVDEPRQTRGDEPALCGAEVYGNVRVEGDEVVIQLKDRR